MDNQENFELKLRLFGTEVIGFQLTSESPRKMWMVMGTITILLLVTVANQIVPLIHLLTS